MGRHDDDAAIDPGCAADVVPRGLRGAGAAVGDEGKNGENENGSVAATAPLRR